jgi:hypothetical protein
MTGGGALFVITFARVTDGRRGEEFALLLEPFPYPLEPFP